MLFIPSLAYVALPLLLTGTEAASSAQGSATRTALPTAPVAPPAPTASPLPPVSPFVGDLLTKLATAVLYASLFANGGDYQAFCDAIIPENLSGIGPPGINGTGVKNELCTGATLVARNADFGPFLTEGNQRGVTYLATALFAVQVAGGFAGGPDLAMLCSEIEAELVNTLFIGFTDTDVGSQVKDYVCSAAASPTPNRSGYYNYTLPWSESP